MKKADNENLPNELPPLKEKVHEPETERGLPQDLTSNKTSNTKKLALALVGVAAIAFAVLSLMMLKSNNSHEVIESNEVAEPEIKNSRPFNFKAEQESLMRELAANQSNLNEPSPTVTPSTPISQNTYTPPTSYQPSTPPEPRRELQGNVLVDISVSGGGNNQGFTQSMASTSSNRTLPVSRETDFSEQLVPSNMPQGFARKRADLTYLLGRGTNIPCTLNTKIVTTQAGITRCTVNKDIYSQNGKVLLIERGSKIIGEQTSALVHGQARVFVLWNAIETPYGVSVEINSPAADSLGASGQPAYVDNHFWQRFGGAIMLSLIDDVASAAANSQRSRNNEIEFDYTRDSARDMAALALENTINIPPTGYVNQGTLLNVMVARDVDFSDIYKLVHVEW